MTITPSVLITGASSGIGAVYADRFARRGHDLVLVARDRARMEKLADRLRNDTGNDTGVNVDILQADLTNARDFALVEARLRDDSRIGILVNNAGMSAAGGFLDQSVDDVTKIVDLNAVALLRLAHAAASRFAKEGAGAIINIGSVAGFMPEWGSAVYGATKAFVLFLSQGLQAELGSKGVYVQAVLPAATRTEIWARSGKDINKLPAVMEVEELVDAALAGFDRREPITIPSLPNLDQWTDLDTARKAMIPNVNQVHAAERYRRLWKHIA
jgi:uncharacterized protein